MATFKSATTFNGKTEGKTFPANKQFEMEVERAEEIQRNVKERYDIDLNFERLDKPEEEVEEVKEAPKKEAKPKKEKDVEAK